MSFAMKVRALALLSGVGLMIISQTAIGKGVPQETNQSAKHASVDSPSGEVLHPVIKREFIPYGSVRRNTSQLRSGTSKTIKSGVKGVREVTYNIFFNADGKEHKN